jgi:Tol biopolymer transport system component
MDSQRWRRIEELYNAARACAPDERARLLDQAEPDVKRKVEQMLNQSGSLLDQPAWEALPEDTMLAAGHFLGRYEIEARLGEGAMGRVFLARDTRLNRTVALKISKIQFGDRFEREARAIAALNHPNICQLHDVGASTSGSGYLVMELIEGESPKGPLPVETVLKYASQIAAGLEAAHEKGIVHRDLKPANLKITPAGVVKILDFGLAKAAPTSSAARRNEDSPTTGITQTGVILGTAAYMSPEQARGERVDKRTDIWAFGVIVHELLAGERLYQGKTTTDVLAAVLTQEPDLSKVPPQVRKLLGRCLEKDPQRRLRDIGDAMALVEEEAPALVAPSRRSLAGPNFAWIVASVLFLLAAAAGFGWWRAMQPVEHPLTRLDVDLGQDVSLALNYGDNIGISPDGTRLAYAASRGGGPVKLFIRKLDQPTATELPGTEGAVAPFFSPDSKWLGFTTRGKVYKISVDGSTPIPLAATTIPTGSSWGEDGNIIHPSVGNSMLLIPSNSGAVTPVMNLASGEVTFSSAQVLPGGKAVLFAVNGPLVQPEKTSIEVLTLADRRRKVVYQGAGSPRYVAASSNGGYLLYAVRNTLFAVPFDLERLETRGGAVPVLSDVEHHPESFDSQYDISRAGTLIYRKAAATIQTATLQWVDAGGKRKPLVRVNGEIRVPRFSPDGKRLAVTTIGLGRVDIQLYDLERETWTNLTSGVEKDFYDAAWSPDGQFLVFGSFNGLFWARSNGAAQPKQLIGKQLQQEPSIAPDGKHVAFIEAIGGNLQIFTAPLEVSNGELRAGPQEPFLKSTFSDTWPAFSPDGKWLAYQSNSSGADEVYVRGFPNHGGLWKVSNNGGHDPIWSQSGHDLLYQEGDQEMAVSYSAGGGKFVGEKPRVWLAKVGGAAMALSPDGRRLVIHSQADPADAPKAAHEVVMLLNVIDELRRRVPAGR